VVGGGGSRKGMGRMRWEGERTRLAQHYDIPRVGADHGGARLMGSNFCLAHNRPKSKYSGNALYVHAYAYVHKVSCSLHVSPNS
jgi:hypothetical protein